MVANRLRKLRELAGLSCHKLALLAGLAGSHVRTLENRQDNKVHIETCEALARVLGCSVGYLAAGEGDCPDEATAKRAVARAQRRLDKSTSQSQA